jgi:hypothetical protein
MEGCAVFLSNVVTNYKYMLIGALAMLCSSVANADYMPYPGKITVNLVNVEAANIVVVGFETWPGFYRTFRVTLPNIEVPIVSASACETALANKAQAFTKTFVTDAKFLRVHDMMMQTSADNDARAHLYTEQGSLADALVKEKLARPSGVNSSIQWCKD